MYWTLDLIDCEIFLAVHSLLYGKSLKIITNYEANDPGGYWFII
jgi:hypothetical protein